MTPTPTDNALPAHQQNENADTLPETRKSSRRKRPIQDAAEDGHMRAQNPPPQTITEISGEKRRKKDTSDVSMDTSMDSQAPSTPAFNPQIPTLHMATPSFLNAYMSSPTPRSSNNNTSLETPEREITADREAAETSDTDNQDLDLDNDLELRERLIAAKVRGAKALSAAATRNPLEKYTRKPDEKLEIHYSSPTAAFDNIDIDQVLSWQACPGGKLLAHPFGNDIRTPELQPEVKKQVFATIVEITQSDSIGCYAPKPGSSFRNNPTVMLIYNLTNEQRKILLGRGVWSSKAVTFRVTKMAQIRPDYLFSIIGFTTKDEAEIKDAVKKTWNTQEAYNAILQLCQSLPENCRPTTQATLEKVVNSLRVKFLDTKETGDISVPTFNVYVKATLIPNDDLWCLLRDYYVTLEYVLPFQNPGITSTRLFHCTICHSIDHPTGLCKFPETERWNGPTA